MQAFRKAQIWLKNVTGDEVIAFLKAVPLPKKARSELIEEMTSYIVTANRSPQKQAHFQPNARSEGSVSSYANSLQRASPGDSALDTALKALNEHNKLVGVSTEEEATMFSALPPSQRPMTAGRALDIDMKAEEASLGTTSPGGSRQFFSHFLYWGSFAICGHGGKIHHPVSKVIFVLCCQIPLNAVIGVRNWRAMMSVPRQI